MGLLYRTRLFEYVLHEAAVLKLCSIPTYVPCRIEDATLGPSLQTANNLAADAHPRLKYKTHTL